MDRQKQKQVRRSRRRTGIRKRVIGTPERPRLSVYRSLNHVYAQVVDDLAGCTLAAASTRDKGFSVDSTGNVAAAEAVGKVIAERATAAGIKTVAFDRGGFRYHGRVKALGDAARKGGLEF
ncbi:LSU ribosomal protein L18p (L5e) [hydrothermal vent metagenome]|uniref:LSU ribosomal protein L18p (L5e) n=1 Tax=hydrothermal vent metagenome TaxID=652676 RepID=A0A3B1DR03_9ZZZZ